MKARLSIVDSAIGREADHHILVEKGRVRGRRVDVATRNKYFPGTRPEEILPRRGRKSRGEPKLILRNARAGRNQVSEKVPVCF